MDEIALLLSILIAGFSILLFIISIVAYYRLQATKLLIVSFAFLAFVIKGSLILAEILSQETLALVIDLVILLILYFAIVKK